MQSVHITTKVVSSNSAHGEVCSIHYVIKFVSELRQVDGLFSPVSSINRTDRHDIAEILLKVALSTIPPPPPHFQMILRFLKRTSAAYPLTPTLYWLILTFVEMNLQN
jgi:hypothetical protein